MVQNWTEVDSSGRALAVGPPWIRTTSGGAEPAGPVTPSSWGRYTSAWATGSSVASAGVGAVGKVTWRGSETLVFFSARERAAIHALAKICAAEERDPTEDELKALLQAKTDAVDVALFGRMLADDPLHNVEAAAQVAHALTVHQVAIEDDFFSAVDDLNRGDEDRGAGHIGDLGFAAGVFYLYVCVDLTQLVGNLEGDRAAAAAGVRGLVEAALTAAPKGKQNSFASRSYASYVLAERGSRQPRTLSTAFIKPLTGGETDIVKAAIETLRACRDQIDTAYGKVADHSEEMDVPGGKGTLAKILDFAARLDPA